MATAHDAAKYAVERLGVLDSLKLQKLTYYMHAWHLVATQRVLFSEEIRAFRLGPVVYDLWKANEGSTSLTVDDFPLASSSNLDSDMTAVADAVLEFYGSMSRWQLIDLTHREAPWMAAWSERQHGRSDSISDASMQSFYTEQMVSGARVPHLPALSTTYLQVDEFHDLLEDLDRPEETPGLHAAAAKARDKLLW